MSGCLKDTILRSQSLIIQIVQVHNICSPNKTLCLTSLRKKDFGCRVPCTGLFADVSYIEGNPDEITKDGATTLDSEVFSQLREDYQAYKGKFVQNIKFNAESPSLGKNCKTYRTNEIFALQLHQTKKRSTSLRSTLTRPPTTRWSRTRR